MRGTARGAALLVAALASCLVRAAGELPEGATVIVPPLTRAMWNQGRHYNLMCPTGLSTNPDGRMYAGCTAVATAILLDYYQWPLQGVGDTKCNEAYWKDSTINLRARFDVPYDWAAMRASYGHVVSARESLAIATLMSDVGAVLNMNYGTSGSSTQFVNVSDVLGKNFFFDNSYAPSLKDFGDEGQVLIQMQLMAGHPILCSGAANDAGTGHTYVCDGFATPNLYHFNFGWGGTNNGWYPLDAVFTSAVPGEEASAHSVDEMLLNVFPERAPLFAERPQVTGRDLTVAWGVATCWTNYLEGLTLERQVLKKTVVNTAIKPTDWAMHKMGEDTCGWSVGNETVSARVYKWGNWGTYWPGMGNCIGSTKGVAISSDTVITISYKAVKLPTDISIKLTQCAYDAGTGEWDDHDASWNLRTLATLPCGSSSLLQSKQVVICGSEILAALGGNATDVHFGINFGNPNYDDPTFAGGTEIFRLESFVVSGEAEDWVTDETRKLPAEARSTSFTGLAEGNHRFKITAEYAEGPASRTSEQRVSKTLKVPTARVVETNATRVVFEVSDADNFGYSFEKQSNALKGTDSQSGNRVMYTFANPVAGLGTHWLTLTVSNRVNGLVGKCVHITNPPVDHPLSDVLEPTVSAAVARAKREGKLVLLLSSGDPDGKLAKLPAALTADNVVAAIRKRFILVECLATTGEGYALSKCYWRKQPLWDYDMADQFTPLRKAYLYVVDPTKSDVPASADSRLAALTRYMSGAAYKNYLNSQLDIANIYVSATTATDIVRFLSQDFITTPARPMIFYFQ